MKHHRTTYSDKVGELWQAIDPEMKSSARALMAFFGGDFRDTIRECEVGISGTDTESRNALVFTKGWAHLMVGEFEVAARDFSTWIGREAERDETPTSLGHQFRAECYERLGQWKPALSDLDTAIARADDVSDLPDLHYRRAGVRAELGVLDAAIEDYDTVLHLNPQHPMAPLHRYFLKQPVPDALEFAASLRLSERAAENLPAPPPQPTLNTALDKLVDGNLEAAINICNWLLEYQPEEKNTVFVIGLAKDLRGRRFGKKYNYLEADKDYNAAIEDYSVLLDQHPDSHFSTLAAARRGQLLLTLGSAGDRECLTGAIADFSMVIDRKPTDASAYLHRGRAYLARYDYEEAVSDFNQVIDLDPENSVPYELNGIVALLHLKGKPDYEFAVGTFREARKYCVEDSPTEMRLMLFESAAEYVYKRYDQALVLLREVEARVESLRGWDWHEFQRKLMLLRNHLDPKIEDAEVIEASERVKADCHDAIKVIYDAFAIELRAA